MRPSSTLAGEYGLFAGQENGGSPSGGFTSSAAKHIASAAGSTSATAPIFRFGMGVLLGQPENVDRPIAADRRFRPVDLDDMAHVVRARSLGVHAAVAPGVVFFGHQHV